MQDLSTQAAYYLEQLKSFRCDWDNVYHSLIEADHGIIPLLIAAFRNEPHPTIRAFLVEVIWQHRLPDTTVFLAEVLEDSNSTVWKNALDGLVALSTPEAIEVLRVAKRRATTMQSDQIRCIEEALELIK